MIAGAIVTIVVRPIRLEATLARGTRVARTLVRLRLRLAGIKGETLKAIYKYRLPFMEVATVEMPKVSHVIRVDGLDGALWIWAIVDTEAPIEKRTFHLFKTGAEMPEDVMAGGWYYHGCGAIQIQMELMMYVFEKQWSPSE
jgi:hypothetical protein